MSFWQNVPRPFYCVAPMANVTDAAFRRILSDIAKPSVMWTEFVSCEALTHDANTRKRMMTTLMYSEQERPIVAQLFGSKPHQFYESAMIVKDLGFDGIDINMGCPEYNVNKQGSGAALIRTPILAQDIVRECTKGAGDLPVTIKTRLGISTTLDSKSWLMTLLETEPEGVTLHGRTRDEMSNFPAHWDVIGELAHFAKDSGSEAFILGNGDVTSMEDAKAKISTYGVDGIMVGRALLGNPWFFQNKVLHQASPHLNELCGQQVALAERFQVMRKHTEYFEELLYNDLSNSDPMKRGISFARMRKFYGAYLQGIPNAKIYRSQLANVKCPAEAYEILDTWLGEHSVDSLAIALF